MWFVEICRDNGAEYETIFTGLFTTKLQAEEKASKYRLFDLKKITFVEVVK